MGIFPKALAKIGKKKLRFVRTRAGDIVPTWVY